MLTLRYPIASKLRESAQRGGEEGGGGGRGHLLGMIFTVGPGDDKISTLTLPLGSLLANNSSLASLALCPPLAGCGEGLCENRAIAEEEEEEEEAGGEAAGPGWV